MEPNDSIDSKEFWKQKIKAHWLMFTLCIIAIVACTIGALMVFIWHIETSPIGLQGDATFDQWSLNWIVGFFIVLILWEMLFIGVPAGLFFGLGGYLWWRRLPTEEKNGFNAKWSSEKKSKHARNAGGGFSLVLFIFFCIYMMINGTYYAEFGSQPYSYWIYSYLMMIGWILIIIGIPAAIICVIWYITKGRK